MQNVIIPIQAFCCFGNTKPMPQHSEARRSALVTACWFLTLPGVNTAIWRHNCYCCCFFISVHQGQASQLTPPPNKTTHLFERAVRQKCHGAVGNQTSCLSQSHCHCKWETSPEPVPAIFLGFALT